MFDITSDEARLLLNIALMAVGRNRFQSAEKILTALEAYRPNSEQLAIARLILFISRGEFDEGLEFADKDALVKHPHSEMLKAFKAMTLLRLERKDEATELLQRVASQNSDSVAAQLAKDMMI